jgi:hypothetical protein
MVEISGEKIIDERGIASGLDRTLREAASLVREELGLVPRLVEIAYTDFDDFGTPYDGYFEYINNHARNVGIIYEV